MSANRCTELDFSRLAAYWLGELDQTAEAQIEEHLFTCADCTERLQFLERIGHGVRALVQDGALGLYVTHSFLDQLRAEGLRLREYHLGPGDTVNCTITPQDDFVVSRLEAPLADVARVDAVMLSEGGLSERHEDVFFDAASGEILLMPSASRLRAIPRPVVEHVRLLAVDPQGERLIGEYRFNHTPYGAGSV